MGSLSESNPSLPEPHLSQIASGISLMHPLSRLGFGPGMIVLLHEIEHSTSNRHDTAAIIDGIPSPAMKWAEEGYTVVEVRKEAFVANHDPLEIAINALAASEVCKPKDTIGLIAYSPSSWNLVAPTLKSHPEISGASVYADANSLSDLITSSIPIIQHLAGEIPSHSPMKRTKQLTQYCYTSMKSFAFASPSTLPNTDSIFHYATEAVSHTRNLAFLKKIMDGPWFDLEAIWDEHTYFEFEVRDTQKTMATMVQEPYVNHVPTITGGIGRRRLSDFYQNHFIFNNPADTELELISRTVGVDRVVDEFVFKFTHDTVIDWLLPGIPPTYRRAEIPFTAIVNIRGDRLYHEHIAWDQATTLKQLGLLPDYLPWPAELKISAEDSNENESRHYEYQVPVAGVETAMKLRDKNRIDSNEMFAFKIRETKSQR